LRLISGGLGLCKVRVKYISKTLGLKVDAFGEVSSDAATVTESGTAEQVRRHRETYGIRSIQFFGIEPGALTCWDLLRQVKLSDALGRALPVPPAIAELAAICQQDKGAGIAEYFSRLGGLAAAPVPALYNVKPLKVDTITAYRAKSSKIVGVDLLGSGVSETHVIKADGNEIMRHDAAVALQSASDSSALGVFEKSSQSSLVQIGITVTANEQFSRAVSADVHKNHTVIASAGSGKTALLVNRCAFLIQNGVPATSIAITTFTKKAAAEIHERLDAAGVSGVQVGTMHRLAMRWLRAISAQPGYAAAVAALADKSFASTYDKLLALATMHAAKDKYLLLDESQDLSPDQWLWAKANARTLYAVGDHRQSIYAWRGAERGGLLSQAFDTGSQPDLYTDGGSFDLSVNRRSCAAIVDFANRIVPASRPALAERSGGSVTALRVSFASDEIAALIQFAKTSQGTAAILARTNAEVAKIKAELTLANFPHLPVLTIHGAKGLAWDSVAVSCGHRKQSDLSDEARETLYVACTRARDSLFLTSVGTFPLELEEALA
jgi:hypothetical protein